MTQEEIIKRAYEVYPKVLTYTEYGPYAGQYQHDRNEGLREAYIKGLTEQLESYLPSNLDEAAEKYAYDVYPSEGVANIEINNAFKAGAEWVLTQILTASDTKEQMKRLQQFVNSNKLKMYKDGTN